MKSKKHYSERKQLLLKYVPNIFNTDIENECTAIHNICRFRVEYGRRPKSIPKTAITDGELKLENSLAKKYQRILAKYNNKENWHSDIYEIIPLEYSIHTFFMSTVEESQYELIIKLHDFKRTHNHKNPSKFSPVEDERKLHSGYATLKQIAHGNIKGTIFPMTLEYIRNNEYKNILDNSRSDEKKIQIQIHRIQAIHDWIINHKSPPSTMSTDIHEARLGEYLHTYRTIYNNSKSSRYYDEVVEYTKLNNITCLTKVNDISGRIKTQLDDIKKIHAWKQLYGHTPKTTGDTEERRLSLILIKLKQSLNGRGHGVIHEETIKFVNENDPSLLVLAHDRLDMRNKQSKLKGTKRTKP